MLVRLTQSQCPALAIGRPSWAAALRSRVGAVATLRRPGPGVVHDVTFSDLFLYGFVAISAMDEMQSTIEAANMLEANVSDAINRLSKLINDDQTTDRYGKDARRNDSDVAHRIRALEEKAANQRATLLETQADLEKLLSGYSENPEQNSEGTMPTDSVSGEIDRFDV